MQLVSLEEGERSSRLDTRRFPEFRARSDCTWAWLSWAIPAAASLAQGLMGKKQSKDSAEANIAMQREFAQQGVRWRVQDAKAAGIHPLYALGAQTHSFSPVSVGDNSMGRAIGDMGQDIGRAVMQGQTQKERNQSANAWMNEQQEMSRQNHAQAMERGNLELEAARLQLQRLQQQVGPAIPSPVRSGEATGVPIPAASPVGLSRTESTGFKRYRAGDTAVDLPNSEMSEALEGMGAMGHLMTPYLMWEHSKAVDMHERAAQYAKVSKVLGPPKAGHYWKYDPAVRGWREEPKQGFTEPRRPRQFSR